MIRKLTAKLSPASVLAMVALFVALGGGAYAAAGKIGSAGIKNGAITKAKIKKEAVTGPKLKKEAVTGVKIKNDAVTGAKVDESTLGTVPDAAKLGGKEPAAFESRGFATPEVGVVNLPTNATTTVASQSLPAGTYLILARGGLNNNGGEEVSAGEDCALSAGGSSQTIAFGALEKNGQPGDREEFSTQIVATLAGPGEATLSCAMSGGWKSGNVTDPSIVAVSLQP